MKIINLENIGTTQPIMLLLAKSNLPISKNLPPVAKHLTEAKSFSSANEFNTISTPLPSVSIMIICSNDESLEFPIWLSGI